MNILRNSRLQRRWKKGATYRQEEDQPLAIANLIVEGGWVQCNWELLLHPAAYKIKSRPLDYQDQKYLEYSLSSPPLADLNVYTASILILL